MGRSTPKERERKARIRKQKRLAEKCRKSRLQYYDDKAKKEDEERRQKDTIVIENRFPARPQPCQGDLRNRMVDKIKEHNEKYGKLGEQEKLRKIVNNQHLT